MKSIFSQSDISEFIERINRLTPQSNPQWGKMDAAQMLAHCQAPLLVALGELKLKRGLMGILFGSMAKKKLTGPSDFSKNLPTAPSFLIKEKRNFETEKKALISLISKFPKVGPEAITKEAHPFFGSMTPYEWDILQTKHLDHHLKQFGL